MVRRGSTVGSRIIASVGILDTLWYKLVLRYVVVRRGSTVGRSVIASTGISDTLWYLPPGVLRYVVVRSSLVNVGRSVIA